MNKELRKEWDKRYRVKHPDKIKELKKRYYYRHRERILKKQKETAYSSNYRKRIGKEEWYRRYGEKNKIRMREYSRVRQGFYTNKNSELYRGTTIIGRKFEEIALSILSGSYDCNKDGHCKWDLLWNGKRIEVKMRNLGVKGKWHFTKKNNDCDYYLLFCCISGKINRIYFIPADKTKSCVDIYPNKNKWREYILNYEGVYVM